MLTLRRWIMPRACLLGLLFGPSLCRADMVTFVNGTSTESGGNAIATEADFVTSTNTVTVTLKNLLVNPKTVAQNISDLFFKLSDTSLTSGSLSSSSAQLVTVAADGTPTLGSTVSTGWGLDTFNNTLGFHLNDLGFAGPAHTIIGAPDSSGIYSNAKGSIAGNGPHNPFLNQSATFTVTIAGVTSATKVTGATFSFNTVAGDNVTGKIQSVPEPASIALSGIGIGGLGLVHLARRRRRTSQVA